MTTKKKQHVNHCFCLIFLSLYFTFISTFNNDISTLNPAIIASSSFCVQDLLGNSSPNNSGIFQNKMTKSLFYTTDTSIVTQIAGFPTITFKEIKCLSKERVILLAQNSTIYEYNATSGMKSSFDSPWAKAINIITVSNNQQKLVYTKNESIHIKSFPLTPLSQQSSYTINTTITTLKCSIKRNKTLDGYCFFIPVNQSSLMFFHISQPQILYERPMTGIKTIAISQISERIYAGFGTGQIRQYSIIESGLLLFERQTKRSLGLGIINLVVNQLRGQLLYLNSAYKIGIINLISGYEIGQTTQLSAFSNPTTTLSLLSRNSIAVFNPSQLSPTIRLLNTQTIITNSGVSLSQKNPLAKLCSHRLQFYNTTINHCQLCTKWCSLCDQQSGQCIKCQNGYFMHNQICLNCKYASITSDYYSLCFKDNQLTVLSYTTAITPTLTSTIHLTYSLLSSSALLFLFLRFINFWSIVSLYYFLNIEQMPFFLLQILSKIFTILYGSVFQLFEIDITYMNMGIKQKDINQKMIATQITTDFIAANFQSIIMYSYSLLLICVLYDGIKQWFKKFKIHVFENVKLQACLEEFVGIFITLLVPSYLFIEQPNFNCFFEKLNNSLFIILLGIGFVFPFFYTILTLERVTLKKRIRQIKRSLKKKGIISDGTILQSQVWGQKRNKEISQNKIQKRLIRILSQEETQKFLYCLNCFWSPFLVGFKSPTYFLAFGFINHFLCLWNAFYAKQWKYNMILGKFIFFLYHLSFVLMKLIPSEYFSLSVIAFSLLVTGGFHQLLSAIGQKIYFVFLILKNKGIIKSNKINMDQNSEQKQVIFDLSDKQKSLNSKIFPQEVSSENFQKSSLKNIEITKTNVGQSAKRIIKNVKILDNNQNLVKKILDQKVFDALTWNQQKSLQTIDLKNEQTQQIKNNKAKIRVKFSNVQNIMNNKMDDQISEEINPQKNKNKIQNKQYEFKVPKLNKLQRRALFDQQFGQFDLQKQNNNTKEQKKKSMSILGKNLTFSHSQEPKKKKVKFLKMDTTLVKLGEFSKTQPQTKRIFSIKQN